MTSESTNPFSTLAGRFLASRDGQQVGQDGSVVPSEVPVGSGLVFPGIAPVRSGADQRHGSVPDRCFARRGPDQASPVIAGAKPAQRRVGGIENIDTGVEILQVAANGIEFHRIQRAGASGGAKLNFASRVSTAPRQTGRVVQNRGEILGTDRSIRSRVRLGETDDRERRASRLSDIFGQEDGLERRVDLEQPGPVRPIEEVRVGADALIRVLRAVVVLPGILNILV